MLSFQTTESKPLCSPNGLASKSPYPSAYLTLLKLEFDFHHLPSPQVSSSCTVPHFGMTLQFIQLLRSKTESWSRAAAFDGTDWAPHQDAGPSRGTQPVLLSPTSGAQHPGMSMGGREPSSQKRAERVCLHQGAELAFSNSRKPTI